MNLGYLMYQAERPLSRTESRAVDAARGELARSVVHLFHPRNLHLRNTAPAHQASCPQADTSVPDYLPEEWVHCTATPIPRRTAGAA
jgi:hypothetical protein